MKKKLSVVCFVFIIPVFLSAQTDLDYYLPENISLNPGISSPHEVINYYIGDWHISHDQLVSYAKAIATESDRAQIFEYAKSWEKRPLYYIVFTDPSNQKELEEIRKNHINTSKYGANPRQDMTEPLIVHLGYGVHGNESSASNSSLLTLYYLAASQEQWLKEFLRKNIILVDPCLNPDGFTRHSTWINQNRSKTLVSDPSSRGFHEPWPGGRMNHYWFDLNRDYIPLAHPESKGRIETFHKWLPHIYTDHHEMGANSTFFFQPGVKTRNNPVVPEDNYRLTRKIATYHAKELDKIGTRYFTEERFDDYYFGKGSSYPDAHGSIGILFEQAGYRGHLRETENGLRSFPFAVRNQFRVSLSTLKAARDMSEELKSYQKDFFRKAVKKGQDNDVKAYVFSEKSDKSRLNHFIDLLNKHKIKVHRLKEDVNINGYSYEKEHSFLVETAQEQYHLVISFFEPVNEFRDTTFYDVSTWTLPYSYNIDYSEITSESDLNTIRGELTEVVSTTGELKSEGEYVLILSWEDSKSPAILYEFLKKDIQVFVSTRPFSLEGNKYNYGSVIIPLHNQKYEKEEILSLAEEYSRRFHVDLTRVSTGLSDEGINLGSGRMEALTRPEIALITGEGNHAYTAGEIWHLLDTRYNIPVTLLDAGRLSQADLGRYTSICISGWDFDDFGEKGKMELKEWVEDGGTLISIRYPLHWLKRNEFTDIEFVEYAQPDHEEFQYIDRYKINDRHRIAGSIFEIKADLSHPLFFSYRDPIIPVFKNNTSVIKENGNSFHFPARYSEKPLLSGYSSPENIERIAGSPYIYVQPSGRGRIIHFMDNPNFRAMWWGTNRIFLNAIFFGSIL
jgi:hypothetical protein